MLNNDTLLNDEVNSVSELLLAVVFSALGFTSLMLMILAFTTRLNGYERFDKISANTQYAEAVANTYHFTPYQAYMIGYNIDPWGPDDLEVTWVNHDITSINVPISVELYNGDLIMRNNMISGANNTDPSVRSVLDSIRGTANMVSFYRSDCMYLNWSKEHSIPYNTTLDDGITVWETNKRDLIWTIEQREHR